MGGPSGIFMGGPSGFDVGGPEGASGSCGGPATIGGIPGIPLDGVDLDGITIGGP